MRNLNKKQIAMLKMTAETQNEFKDSARPFSAVYIYTVEDQEYQFRATMARHLVKEGYLKAVNYDIDGKAYTFRITAPGQTYIDCVDLGIII